MIIRHMFEQATYDTILLFYFILSIYKYVFPITSETLLFFLLPKISKVKSERENET